MFGRITDPARGRHKTIHVMQDLFKISFFVTCGRHSSFKWHSPNGTRDAATRDRDCQSYWLLTLPVYKVTHKQMHRF